MKSFIIIIITILITGIILKLSAVDYVTESGWEFSQNWDYRCDNGYTYNVANRSIYPLFNKQGFPLKCKEV